MRTYRNRLTGFEFSTESVVTGEKWEEITPPSPAEEKPAAPKTAAGSSGKGKRTEGKGGRR